MKTIIFATATGKYGLYLPILDNTYIEMYIRKLSYEVLKYLNSICMIMFITFQSTNDCLISFVLSVRWVGQLPWSHLSAGISFRKSTVSDRDTQRTWKNDSTSLHRLNYFFLNPEYFSVVWKSDISLDFCRSIVERLSRHQLHTAAAIIALIIHTCH